MLFWPLIVDTVSRPVYRMIDQLKKPNPACSELSLVIICISSDLNCLRVWNRVIKRINKIIFFLSKIGYNKYFWVVFEPPTLAQLIKQFFENPSHIGSFDSWIQHTKKIKSVLRVLRNGGCKKIGIAIPVVTRKPRVQ